MKILGQNFFPDSPLKVVSFGGSNTTTPLAPNVNGRSINVPPNEKVAVPVEFADNLRDSGHDVLIEDYVDPAAAPVVGDDISVVSAEAIIADATATGERMVTEMLETAKTEAQKLLDEATTAANLATSNAKVDADKIVADAKAEADKIIADAPAATAPVEKASTGK
jgi:vacuolar-type H+-ATPase subunit H